MAEDTNPGGGMIRPTNPMIRPSKLSDPSPAPLPDQVPTDDNPLRMKSMLEAQRLKSRLVTKPEGTEAEEEVPEDKPILHSKKGAAVADDSILADPRAFRIPTPRDYNTILQVFHNNVVELRFVRRTPKYNGTTRRMLCTANWKYLSSVLTRRVFGWSNPKSRRGTSWYKMRRLVIVWDLLINNFRIISLDDWSILGVLPLQSLEDKAQFLVFYNEYISRMGGKNIDNYHNS